ncbi:hypothetical protein [Synechococcus phage BUCT-ZZ01]|nr:hypothetical protein [Synechococcus phage BUCT-ZZ01]
MKAYKIFSKSRQLYSKGGTDVHLSKFAWGKKGKTWSSKQAIVLHLIQYNPTTLQKFEEDFIVKEFDFETGGVTEKKVSDIIDKRKYM